MTHTTNDLSVLRSPGTVLAAVPYLLGFRPESSAVLILLEQQPSTVRVTMRVDLPGPTDSDAWVEQVASIAARAGVGGRSALLLGFGPGDASAPLRMLRERLTRLGGTVLDVLILGCDRSADAEARWHSESTEGEPCCPDGHLISRADRKAARRLLRRSGLEVVGEPPLRSQVVAELAPQPEAVLPICDMPAPGPATRELAVAQVRDALASGPEASVDAVALAASALRDARVRDTVIWDLLHEDPTRWATCADQLAAWVPRLPDGHLAPVATVLAVLRWQCGDGTRGSVALDRALAIEPDYRLAVLLRAVIDAGEPPRAWLDGLCGMSREACLGRVA